MVTRRMLRMSAVVGVSLVWVASASAECIEHKRAGETHIVVKESGEGGKKVEIRISGTPGEGVKVEAPSTHAVTVKGADGAPGTPGKSAK